VAADLFASAMVEGRRESRSARQQLDYWARLGRAVSMHQTATRRRVVAALAGELPLGEMTPEERLVANAEIDATIEVLADRASFGTELAAEGVTTVALDETGALVEYRPDGTTTVLAGAPKRRTRAKSGTSSRSAG
jgi:hypothetical protein